MALYEAMNLRPTRTHRPCDSANVSAVDLEESRQLAPLAAACFVHPHIGRQMPERNGSCVGVDERMTNRLPKAQRDFPATGQERARDPTQIKRPALRGPHLSDLRVMIGSSNFGQFLGVIDKVRIYNRELSPAEIASIAAADL